MDKFKIIAKNHIEELPKTAGVYSFLENGSGHPIYIGKAINIKNRAKNHFNQPSYRDNLFMDKVQKIGFIETGSEISALILEANLIKKHQPKFNVVWKDDKNYFYVAIAQNKDKIPYVFITHKLNSASKTEYIGPFVEGNALKKTIRFLRKVFPYYTIAKHSKLKCQWCHIDLCPGPNPDVKDYKKNIKKLILVLEGKSSVVLNLLKKEMKQASAAQDFEKASKLRDKIYNLERVMLHKDTMAGKNKIESAAFAWQNTQKKLAGLLNIDPSISKIECFDISNIQGKLAVGSMVVFINGEPDKSQYKKFRIKMENEPNDIAMLKEVLERRFLHPEWKYPEIILIDGGIAQLNIGIKTKNVNKQTQNIKVISIAKGRQELFIENKEEPIPLKYLPQEIYNLIKNLDDEAHRFAITYHKKIRKQSLLK